MAEKVQRRTPYRVGFVVTLVLLIVAAILTPFGIRSMMNEAGAVTPEERIPYSLTPLLPPNSSDNDYTRLHIDIVAIDEVGHLVTLRVSGTHICRQNCTSQDTVLFFSYGTTARGVDSFPPSESITLPPNLREVSAKFQLPVDGEIQDYPFDKYSLKLAVAVQRTDSSGNVVSLTPDQERGHLVMTLQQHLTRTVMPRPKPIDPSTVQPNAGDIEYLYVNTMTLSRPVYLQILVVLAVLLIAAAAFFAVTLCPFDQLIINTGAVVLGIWAVRSLLLGGFPPDATFVDLALLVSIFTALVGITVRALNHMHERSGWYLLPWHNHLKPKPQAVATDDVTPVSDKTGEAAAPKTV
jgi:hypothetical protein